MASSTAAASRRAGARAFASAAASVAAPLPGSTGSGAAAGAAGADTTEQGPVATVLASMRRRLGQRAATGKLRRLPEPAAPGAVDFTSNDYLGLARCPELARRVQAEADRVSALSRRMGGPVVGATGSRLLSGSTWYHEEVEAWMATFFRREAALVFNSGYDLNLGLLAALARPGDAVVFDEYVHNSSVMGLRLGGWHHHRHRAQQQQKQQKQQSSGQAAAPPPPQATYIFRHNYLPDLRRRLAEARAALGPAALLYVAVESVYSMDGDIAPLGAICDAAAEYGAAVIVDEAHSTGVLGPGGRGLVAQEGLEEHPALLCSIHTFGKALGCHGAVLCGPKVLMDYCANYCAPFIYSTASGFHSLAAMRVACELQAQQDDRRQHLHGLVRAFQTALTAPGDQPLTPGASGGCALLPSPTPIQAVLVPGNERCSRVAAALQRRGLDVRPLRPPTVPAGRERLRVVLHAHNTAGEVAALARQLKEELMPGVGVGVGVGVKPAASSTASSSTRRRDNATTTTHATATPTTAVAAAAAAAAAAAPSSRL